MKVSVSATVRIDEVYGNAVSYASSVAWSEQRELQRKFHSIGGAFGMIRALHTMVGVVTPSYRAIASRHF